MIHIPDLANATPIQILFCILSIVTLATAFLTIYSRNPIHSAIYLVICFFSIAGHYLLLNAQFLAIVHVIVYSGAIMILFLFTVMLMKLKQFSYLITGYKKCFLFSLCIQRIKTKLRKENSLSLINTECNELNI